MKEQRKTAVVTGSTGGMGRVLCNRLAGRGYDLGICATRQEAVREQAGQLRQKGCRVVSGAFDIFEEGRVDGFFEQVERELGKCSLLVNMAGLSIPTKMDTVSSREYDAMLNVNVKGTLLCAKYFAQHAADEGLIVNIGSMAAKRANGNAPLYCAAKAAVNMLSEGMRIQLAEKDIRVTTLNPGGTDTPFWGERQVNRERLMKAEDVADIILFVAELPARIAVHEIDFESFAMLRQGRG